MKLVKPSEAEVGKVYRVVTTTYSENMVGYSAGCLVKVLHRLSNGCQAAPVNGPLIKQHLLYLDEWRGIKERFVGPIEDVNQSQSIFLCPKCGGEGEKVFYDIRCRECWWVW